MRVWILLALLVLFIILQPLCVCVNMLTYCLASYFTSSTFSSRIPNVIFLQESKVLTFVTGTSEGFSCSL